MTDERSSRPDEAPPVGWSRPQPETTPSPSAWPAALALATTLMIWGTISSFIVSCVGAVLFVAALTGWIREVCHDR